MKRTPTGFIATCQCGVTVGAIDSARCDQKHAGRILGKWLSEGCTLSPKFDGTWEVEIKACQCNSTKATEPDQDSDLIGRLDDAITEALGDALDCTRVWSAWGIGTMGEDDFVRVADDPARIMEIRNAALLAFRSGGKA